MHPIKTFLTSCLILSGLSSLAQVTRQPDTTQAKLTGFTAVETEASYPGGNVAWIKYLEKKLDADVPVKNKAPVGKYTAFVRFIVSKDGSVSNVTPVTKYGYGMEEEVVRVIEGSGKWVSAIQNGKPVNAYRKQPITFITEDENFKITTQEPYTLFADIDNEITVSARKIKPADISINVQGGKSISVSDGKFIIRISKPGRVIIEVVNNKKDDREIGLASFEVIAK